MQDICWQGKHGEKIPGTPMLMIFAKQPAVKNLTRDRKKSKRWMTAGDSSRSVNIAR